MNLACSRITCLACACTLAGVVGCGAKSKKSPPTYAAGGEGGDGTGGSAGTGVGSGGQPATFVGYVEAHPIPDFLRVEAHFWPGEYTEPEQTALDDLSQWEMGVASAFGVPLGLCGAISAPDTDALPEFGDAGESITLLDGSTTVGALERFGAFDSYWVDVPSDGLPPLLDVRFDGAGALSPDVLLDALPTGPNVTITAPAEPLWDLGDPLTWEPLTNPPPSGVTRVFLVAFETSLDTGIVCNVDPSAGTFTVPVDVVTRLPTPTSGVIHLQHTVVRTVGGRAYHFGQVNQFPFDTQ